MTIHGARAGRLFGIAGLVLLFTASAANAWGKDGCVSFQATTQGSFLLWTPSLPNGGWVFDGYFTIGDLRLHATIVYDADSILAKKITRNTFLGAEKGVANVDGGGTFDLVSHFTAPHQAFTTGVAILNESGTITNGTGRFANISGHFTNHGIYGPAVAGNSTDPLAVVGGITDMQGNICGVDLSAH
jgi:hypothetical protein